MTPIRGRLVQALRIPVNTARHAVIARHAHSKRLALAADIVACGESRMRETLSALSTLKAAGQRKRAARVARRFAA